MQKEVNVMKSLSKACIASSIVGMAYVMYFLFLGAEVIDSTVIMICLFIFGVCLKED